MEGKKRNRPRYRQRQEEVGGEWIKLLLCLLLVLAMGILNRAGMVSKGVLEQALLGDAPRVNWREHTEETLGRIGELFCGKDGISG